MDVRLLLLAGIVLLTLPFVGRWVLAARRTGEGVGRPSAVELLIGVVVNFLDTLGIGSLATTTTAFRALRLVPDERLPGTMIVGLTLPVVAQALIFITAVQIDGTLLLAMIGAALAGGWLGARVVARLPRRPIRLGMGVALLVAALFMTLGQLGRMPIGGTALGLAGAPFALAVGVNLVLGALVMLGIGNYGPTFVLLSVLGMDPRAAFPIMMGSGAYAALVGASQFLRHGAVVQRPALGLALGGVPGVLLAALLVKSLPLDLLRWVIVVVVAYAAVSVLRAAERDDADDGSRGRSR
jgi:uncharacterized membrane protein YfcA